jgi:hypothetical protein
MAKRVSNWGITIIPRNHMCWAIYYNDRHGARHVRRIVWGRLLARAEKRPGEFITRASIATRL